MVILYKGFKGLVPEGKLENIWRSTPRNPVSTSQSDHDNADAWFNSKFGVLARSTTLICSTSLAQANDYGYVMKIVPEPPYTIIYSPNVQDFLIHQVDIGTLEEWLDMMKYEKVDNVENLPEDFEGEVMVDCAFYIATAVRSV